MIKNRSSDASFRRCFFDGEKEMNIKEFSTKELVDELKEREGVNTITAEPYEKKIVDLEGPAIVLIVTD